MSDARYLPGSRGLKKPTKPAATTETKAGIIAATTETVGVASMLDAGIIDDLTKAANSVKVNSGACPQKGGAGSETGGARGPTRSDLDLSGHVKEEVPDVKPLPDSGDNDPSARLTEYLTQPKYWDPQVPALCVESSSEEEAVTPLFEPGEGMDAQAARPTAGAEKDAAQEGEGGGEEAEAGGEAKGEGGDPKPRAEAAEAEKQCAQAQAGEEAEAGGEVEGEGRDPKRRKLEKEVEESETTSCHAPSGSLCRTGLPAAPSPAPSGFDTPKCVPPGQGYHVPEDLKQLVLQAQCSVSLH